jgi:hypothetical protein
MRCSPLGLHIWLRNNRGFPAWNETGGNACVDRTAGENLESLPKGFRGEYESAGRR